MELLVQTGGGVFWQKILVKSWFAIPLTVYLNLTVRPKFLKFWPCGRKTGFYKTVFWRFFLFENYSKYTDVHFGLFVKI